ncbi:MAG: nitroreductase [Saprospiraceae bacterium]|nr:nitroreductase [Saprospiraceae bacterium]MBL0101641.1 nitroreductase [Saprospiraceae bacterium]
MLLSPVSDIIRRRRSIYPPVYKDTPISDEVILEILENANWAPTHKMTQPWRFSVIRGEKLTFVKDYIGQYYKDNAGQEYSELKYHKMTGNIEKSACIIAIGMHRDSQDAVAEWEEMAAVAMAVQNMWLTCASLGIGAYWGTSAAARSAATVVGFEEGVRCLGFFFMGYTSEENWPKSKRSAIQNHVKWL